MSKKKIIEAALVDAEELERAAIENAKNVMIEAFTPSLTDLFKDVLAESDDEEESLVDINPDDITESDDEDADDEELTEDEDFDADDVFGDTDPEETVAEARRRRRIKEARVRRKLRESDDEDADDAEGDFDVFEEEDEHDIGKEPDLGRDDTDASGELEEDDDPYEDADGEEEYPMTEARRRRLREAKRAKMKRIAESRRRRKLREEEGWEAEASSSARALKGVVDDEWEAVHDGNDVYMDPHADEPDGLEGESPANKKGGAFQQKPKKSDPGREALEGEHVANKTGGGQSVPEHPDPGKTDEIGLEDDSPANQTSKDLAEARRRRRIKEARRRKLREADENIDDDEDSDDDEVNINIDTDDEDEVDMGEDDGGDDEELDVPEELFDDEEEVDEDDGEDETDDFDDEGDDEIDLSIENDDDETASPMGGSDDMDLDSMMPDAVGEDDVEDGQLYIRKEGGFQKITPVEFLQTRLAELEQENIGLQAALQALQGQLKETHLFNAKLAYLNKAYASGAFNKTEKLALAERIDACERIGEVKKLYARVMHEVENHNPLDGFSNVIKEQRVRATKKVENVYESNELRRMRGLAGLDD